MTLRLILLVVHISSAATLLGVPLGIPGSIRRAKEGGPAALRHAAADADRRGRIAGITSLLTLVTGIALIFNAGGFASITKNFHAALGLMVLALVVSFTVMKPATGKLVAAVQKEPIDEAAVEAARKKLAMGSGILQTLWLVLLVLMFYRFG